MRHDQDNNKQLVSTYDVVFHDEVQRYLMHQDFQKFVADTAIDGVNRVMAEDKEKLSSDYKIMNNLKCKGGEPALMTIKVETGNPLIDNMDISQTETKLQKEINSSKKDALEKEAKERENERR